MEFLNLIKKLIRWFYPSKKYEGDFWTLKEFINHYGKMQVHIFTDSLGNQSIDRCIFTDCIGRETEVYVAKVLQSYTIEDLINFLLQLLRAGTYVYARNGKILK